MISIRWMPSNRFPIACFVFAVKMAAADDKTCRSPQKWGKTYEFVLLMSFLYSLASCGSLNMKLQIRSAAFWFADSMSFFPHRSDG